MGGTNTKTLLKELVILSNVPGCELSTGQGCYHQARSVTVTVAGRVEALFDGRPFKLTDIYTHTHTLTCYIFTPVNLADDVFAETRGTSLVVSQLQNSINF